MEVNINNRIVLIIGPSTTGKTTLSKKINEESQVKSKIISHDGVLNTINKNQSQEKIDMEFKLEFIKQISDAVKDSSNELIILDTLNIRTQGLMAILLTLKMLGDDGITLIKMHPTLDLHTKYIIQRAKRNKLVTPAAVLQQRKFFESREGSLNTRIDVVDDEFIIENPEDITLNFGNIGYRPGRGLH